MKDHDPRCEGADDQKVIDDVAHYGWHVVKILEGGDKPGWAFSVGLYHTFGHPEIIVFGLKPALMHSIINNIGEDVRSGKRFKEDKQYPDLIEGYQCAFKIVNPAWYEPFLGYATWFYKGMGYSVLQCIWPDKESIYPWEPGFNPNWASAQPLLFYSDPRSAGTVQLLRSMGIETGGDGE
jgi:hypothetical protein